MSLPPSKTCMFRSHVKPETSSIHGPSGKAAATSSHVSMGPPRRAICRAGLGGGLRTAATAFCFQRVEGPLVYDQDSFYLITDMLPWPAMHLPVAMNRTELGRAEQLRSSPRAESQQTSCMQCRSAAVA